VVIDGVGSRADNVWASLGTKQCACLQGSSKLASLFLHRPHSLWRIWALVASLILLSTLLTAARIREIASTDFVGRICVCAVRVTGLTS
jgi:hypothetical protein